jgi:hypothetical protein
MRIILVLVIILGFAFDVSAQSDFITLDKKTYDYYLRGDYANLKKTADTMFSRGMDYYYLRMRLAITCYNKELYHNALYNFAKALEFNSLDTVSQQYIYNSYLLSGRKADAAIFLESIPDNRKNNALKSAVNPLSSELILGSSFAGYDVILYETNSLEYEARKSNSAINAGFETRMGRRFLGTFIYTNFSKSGTEYSPSNPAGRDINFNQNQVYARLTGFLFPGWEISGFGHFAFYSDLITQGPPGYRRTIKQPVTEFLCGGGISKNGWRIRSGANFSLSNFSNSNQIRGEAYLTWLPFGNLKFYLTSGWMGQTDVNWGGTYQVNQEISLRLFKFLWLESGIINGNSFLYARDQGFLLNNSFLIPETTIYGNLIILPGKRLSITLTPFFTQNHNYSWDLNTYNRSNMLVANSFGGSIKIIYKNK